MHTIFLRKLPAGLEALTDLALDLRWTWSHAGDELWRTVGLQTWERIENSWVIVQPILLRTLLFILLAVSGSVAPAAGLPAGFVYIDEVIPDIAMEIRYCSEDNFKGRLSGRLRHSCMYREHPGAGFLLGNYRPTPDIQRRPK